MCNTRQSDEWESPGARAAAFIPRNMYKSTIFTTGGDSWDILRDPNERILIVNAVAEKAEAFMSVVAANFSRNPMMKLLYPEHCAFSSKAGQLSAKGLILPNRTVHYVEPTVKGIGVSGAAEGGHYTRISLDDLVGLDDLSSSRASAAGMEQAKNWLKTNLDALGSDGSARTGVVATRYAVDDCYQRIYDSCKSVRGWTKGDLQPVENGQWNVYYRLVEEDGLFLRPDVMNKQKLDQLMIDDPWSAMTQWYNSPFKAGLAEFAEFSVKNCTLMHSESEGWYIRRDDPNFDEDDALVRLSDCDVVMTVDPAATDKGISAKTCRTSIGVWACDSKDNKYRIWGRVGFYNQKQVIDHIFEGNRLFGGIIRCTYVEVNAYQKVLKEYLDRERFERKNWIPIQGVQAQGDKKARIRVAFGTYLLKGRLWATPDAGAPLREELRLFPMSDHRLDCLDESEKGLTFTRRPESPVEREERRYVEETRQLEAAHSAFGYG